MTAAGAGWLIDDTDAAVDRVPAPPVDGLGLAMIARLCGAYGGSAVAGRKRVWGLRALGSGA